VVARRGRGREQVERHGCAIDWAGWWCTQGNGEKIGAGYRKERLRAFSTGRTTRDGNTFYGLHASRDRHLSRTGVLVFRGRQLVDSLVLPTHRQHCRNGRAGRHRDWHGRGSYAGSPTWISAAGTG
jgi:hypothetical protein